jgi:Heat induced stress protein YflT
MTNGKVIQIVGIYEREDQAVQAVEELKSQGYAQEDISMITNNREMLEKLGIDEPTRSKMNEGAKTGAATGSLIGGLAGLLAGFGAFTIPGVGPILAAGPIAAAFVGGSAGIGIGGITGALIGLGIPEEEANRYEQDMHQEKILVLVEKPNNLSTTKPMDQNASVRELTEVDSSKDLPKRSAMDQIDPSRHF